MTPEQPRVGELIADIKNDVTKIVGDELEIGRATFVRRVESVAPKVAIVGLGAAIALIGLAMLCVTLAYAFHSLIASAAIATLIAAGIYIVVGGAAAAVAVKRLGSSREKETVH